MKIIASRPLRLSPVVAALLGFAAVATVQPAARAQDAVVLTVLHSFGGTSGGGDGSQPNAALVQDAAGNFYGTTYSGGTNNYGTVFEITAAGQYSVLHDFDGGAGAGPDTTLVLGSDGAYYGTTEVSIASNSGPDGGTFYRITPAGQFNLLHRFDGYDGGGSGLILGGDGNFYGTTAGGGAHGGGAVFRLTPQGAFSVVYSFSGPDGSEPYDPVTLGSDGNFYGTCAGGGANGLGAVFKLTPDGKETVLHSFDGTDGNEPHGALVEGDPDAGYAGDFYGVTYHGGLYDYTSGDGGAGTVFHVTSGGAFEVLHNFNGTDGVFPYYGLTKGDDGYYYGTTYHSIFRIDSLGGYTLLYSAGAVPGEELSGLVQTADGSLYGTTPGSDDLTSKGNVFKLTIAPIPSSFFTAQTLLDNGVYYLNYDTEHEYGYDFGNYSYLEDRHYIYSFQLGYEYVVDAADGQNGVYFYDFKSNDFFYTSPSFPYPYLYDFGLKSVVFHFNGPEIDGAGYDTVDNRYFYVFSTGTIIKK